MYRQQKSRRYNFDAMEVLPGRAEHPNSSVSPTSHDLPDAPPSSHWVIIPGPLYLQGIEISCASNASHFLPDGNRLYSFFFAANDQLPL